MKRVLLLACAVLAHVNAQRNCGCCGSPPPCRPPPPCPRPQPCPRPSQCPPPVVVEPLPSYVSPLVSPIDVTNFASPALALPTCNCPSVPSLPVSPQIIPGLQVPPFLAGLGCLSPCLGGVADFSVPFGMINPFLPAASPVSAIAPTVSSLYPPINPCNCACKYLKKIPIPPPFL